MKYILGLGLILSFSLSAAINTKINYNLGKNDTTKIITTALNDGEVKVIKLPEHNQIVEIRATEEIPDTLRNDDIVLGQIFYDIKIYKTDGEKKALISTPKITTLIGEEATLELYDTTGTENFKIKILASGIN